MARSTRQNFWILTRHNYGIPHSPLKSGAESPHIVVARNGAFVTCLGPGMSTAPNPILTRHQLEGMRVRAERGREALHLSESLKGNKDQGASPILGRLFDASVSVTAVDAAQVVRLPGQCRGWSCRAA